jgi:hypothetical protein
MPRITTEQAPSAKPISFSANLTTDWITFADVPDYDVPVVGFGVSRRVAPGVGELSAPILLSNYFTSPALVDIQIVRGTRLLQELQFESDYDLFTGGLGYVSTETITLTNGANVVVDAVDGVGKVIGFTVTTTVGEPVQAVPEPLEQLTTTGVGTGFSLTIEDGNLSNVDGHFYLGRDIRIESEDTLIFPVNGQFLLTRDKLQIRANIDDYIHATVSYTEGQAEEDDIFF